MYSLGRALLDTTPRAAALTGTVSVSPSSALQSVLAAMTEPDPRRRASLMNLLDVSFWVLLKVFYSIPIRSLSSDIIVLLCCSVLFNFLLMIIAHAHIQNAFCFFSLKSCHIWIVVSSMQKLTRTHTTFVLCNWRALCRAMYNLLIKNRDYIEFFCRYS